MTDRTGGLDAQEGDRLPWLEAVDDEDVREGIGSGKLIASVLVALLVIGLLIGGIFWLRDGDSGPASGEPGVITAQEGDYKIKPEAPGGMAVAGKGDAAYAASEGADPNAPIDLSALPEAPVMGNRVTTADAATAPRATVPATGTRPAPVAVAKVEDRRETLAAASPRPVAAAPKPIAAPAVAGGGTVQLGAFSSEAKANAAWKALAGRFSFLSGLTPSVMPVTTDSGTLYRLRTQGAGLCARLRVAGESCTVVN